MRLCCIVFEDRGHQGIETLNSFVLTISVHDVIEFAILSFKDKFFAKFKIKCITKYY